jgi:hypothetical protein
MLEDFDKEIPRGHGDIVGKTCRDSSVFFSVVNNQGFQ